MAVSWHPSIFEIDAGVGLAICVDHRGAHVSAGGNCIVIRSEPRSSDRAYPPCSKHDGRHQNVNGQCVHWGATVAVRPGVCRECSAPIFNRLTLATGRLDVVEEGSDDLHTHPEPVKVQVEINPDDLAMGIAGALESLMQRRREQRSARVPAAAPEPTRAEPATAADLPDVEVWGDDGSPT